MEKLPISGLHSINVEESTRLRKKYRCKIGKCFNNSSSKLTAVQSELNDNGARYVEGIYRPTHRNGFAANHAWIELSNGQIIELTRDELQEEMLYYPILKFSFREMMKIMSENNGKLPLYSHESLIEKYLIESGPIIREYVSNKVITDFDKLTGEEKKAIFKRGK